jgi:small ligand-binding sensory domain FIST
MALGFLILSLLFSSFFLSVLSSLCLCVSVVSPFLEHTMPFAAALSTAADTVRAVADVCRQAGEALGGPPDLAVFFFSPHHLANGDRLGEIHRLLRPGRLIGCVGEAIIGTGQEIEGAPALSLWLARRDGGAPPAGFHLTLERTADGPSLIGWPDALLDADPARSAVLCLGDPFTFPPDRFLAQLQETAPGLKVFGGLASGIMGPGPGEARLWLDDSPHDRGAVGILLPDVHGLRSVVSQGCRPIGRHLLVTRAQGNVILELGGKPPLQQLQELWPTLSEREQALFRQGLHIGQVVNEYQETFGRGDFLVRNVMGLDRDTGALAITDNVRVGQTVQFHVRDADSADEDLADLLRQDRETHPAERAAAGLLFSCNGRGTRLFDGPDHDARAVADAAGDIPLAGFFAMGELGPVGGQNFVHGFTASLALFSE